MMHRLLFAAALAALALPAFAQDTTSGQAQTDATLRVITCPEGSDAPQERDDQRLVESALRAFQQASFPALHQYLPMLREAMDHAPACYPEVERRGNQVIMRVADESQPLTLGLALAAIATTDHQNVTLTRAPNVYMRVSLLLGSYANENHQFEEAISWLDRGLALQPHAQFLVAEKTTALSQLGRKQEAHD